MDLFATGFNAWHQLSINRQSPNETEEEPHDLYRFAKVLSAATIKRPVSRLTYTIVHRDGGLIVAGLVPPETVETEAEFLYTSAEAASGQLLAIVHDKDGDDNDANNSNKLVKYLSLASRGAGAEPESIFDCRPPATQVAAFNTGFVILHSDGSVSTLGDSRFEACLGRDTDTLDRPSDKPGLVPDLNDITSADDPIKLVTAGGTAVAALTSNSCSVYVWGCSPPSAASRTSASASSSNCQTQSRGHAFQELSGVPNYTEVDGGKDVVDVALGEAHAIALTTDGLIYVCGENRNGQLGLGREIERAETWTKVPFLATDGFNIVGVAAGPRASFILTANA